MIDRTVLKASGAKTGASPTRDAALARALGLAALVSTLAGLAQPSWLQAAPLPLVASLLGLLAIHVGLRTVPSSRPSVARAAATDPLDGRLEQLQDLKWELRDNEVRYRELLDSLDDMIVRRGPAGELTFVNRAFCRAFAVTAAEVIGKPWTPVVIEEDGAAGQVIATAADPSHRRRTQKIATPAGLRWIEWDEHVLPAVGAAAGEVQAIGRDVTEWRRYEAELRQARDAALASNRAKSRFLATMSHEIRTPMNGILGMASLIEDTQLTPEQATYLSAIDHSARNLLTLIDEILDFSKIEAGKLAIVSEPFGLRAVIQNTVELLAPRAHEKHLEIGWRVDPAVPDVVIGDCARLRQILLNLISNAVKFTDTGGVQIVAALVHGPSPAIMIAVEDSGIGLSPADMDSLFTEFEQADAAIARRDGGTGLGLAISKRLARALGGEIAVESQPGRGSVFRLTLPLKRPPNGTGGRPDVTTGTGENDAPPQPAGRRVLLAFDRVMERGMLYATLRSAGIDAVETSAERAARAIVSAAAEGAPFDRLIVDGGGDCAALASLLALARTHNKVGSVVGLVLVNLLSRTGLAPLRAAGFDAYLMRPVRPQTLLDQLTGTPPRPGALSAVARPDLAPTDAAPPVNVRAVRVLLAEDNPVNALLATRVLEKHACAVTSAPNGRAAVDRVRASLAGDDPAFDIILMDIFMPELDGVEAARTIKALHLSAGLPCPPIVALTANAFAEARQHYLDQGLDDYLAKPFERASLADLLQRWTGARTTARPAA